jgi:hypothetical protein
MHVNYLIAQISNELESLVPEEIALMPDNISDSLLNVNHLSNDSFEMLVSLMKAIIRWKYCHNL